MKDRLWVLFRLAFLLKVGVIATNAAAIVVYETNKLIPGERLPGPCTGISGLRVYVRLPFERPDLFFGFAVRYYNLRPSIRVARFLLVRE